MKAFGLLRKRASPGPQRVVIMNDWLSDTSSWDLAREFLDKQRLTLMFADLRCYGRSRGQSGRFTVAEAASDVLALTNALGWSRFAVVGHSMSTLVALHLSQHHPEREVTPLTDCGHYPMQEMPPLTAALIERFLGQVSR